MALAQEPPVYKASYDLVLAVFNIAPTSLHKVLLRPVTGALDAVSVFRLQPAPIIMRAAVVHKRTIIPFFITHLPKPIYQMALRNPGAAKPSALCKGTGPSPSLPFPVGPGFRGCPTIIEAVLRAPWSTRRFMETATRSGMVAIAIGIAIGIGFHGSDFR